MGTTFRVVLYAADGDAASRAGRAAFDRIADLDRRLSDYREDSELMRASTDAVQKPVVVSPDLFRVLAIAQELAQKTGGAFDVTAGALTRLWRHARRQGVLPDAAEIEAARRVSGYRLLQLDGATQAIRIEREGVRLDVGGIAKGYAADRALAVLAGAGFPRAMVVAGGDIAVGDPPPDACGWRIAIAPLTPAAAPDTIVVSHVGVSTSGDAEQFMEVDGVRYSHILDTRTGTPLTGHRQVTVVAPDATTSDMLATAITVLGAPEGPRLADDYKAATRLEVENGSTSPRQVFSPRWLPTGPVAGSGAGAPCAGSPAR
jgi:thiamine biosynthesis lipoprotein